MLRQSGLQGSDFLKALVSFLVAEKEIQKNHLCAVVLEDGKHFRNDLSWPRPRADLLQALVVDVDDGDDVFTRTAGQVHPHLNAVDDSAQAFEWRKGMERKKDKEARDEESNEEIDLLRLRFFHAFQRSKEHQIKLRIQKNQK